MMVLLLLLGTGLRLMARTPDQIVPPASGSADQGPGVPGAGDPTSTTDGVPPNTVTTSTTTTLTSNPEPPPIMPGYVVHEAEVEAAAKQVAVDIALDITTYEQTSTANRLHERYPDIGDSLFRPGHWSRGTIIYPQYGGLNSNQASVMVVIGQVIGVGDSIVEETTRTLDIRLIRASSGEWHFDGLASDGGTPLERPSELPPEAIRVVDNPNIWLPDSARWDIYGGGTSLRLLEVMADFADHYAYGVITLTTGHPHHVFGTERTSQHTLGRAVDVFFVDDTEVIHGRSEDSVVFQAVRWLLDHPGVRQVGSPWDLDGRGNSRSFTDAVHQDHLHIAVGE